MVTPIGIDAQVMAAGNAASTKLNSALGEASSKGAQSASDKARKQAQDFEATFLSSMFQHMFTDVKGDGPLGAGPAIGVWRSFLTDQYAKSFAKSGGIGIADQVYKSLMAHQEAHRK
jgi:peptidoglycan hydrolase FlgJ